MTVTDSYEYVTKTKPAPGDLRLVQGFVNTIDFEDGTDLIGRPESLEGWLRELGLMEGDTPASAADVERAHELREAVRALLHANHGDELAADAVETLNAAARRGPVQVRFDDAGGSGLETAAAGVDGALGRLLGIIHTAVADGTWERLKACGQDTCQWAFYDRSKNRSGSWCSMDSCGNRAKARAYRQRRRP
jgi:predicted RNA-binding Zn ribbon-like protein